MKIIVQGSTNVSEESGERKNTFGFFETLGALLFWLWEKFKNMLIFIPLQILRMFSMWNTAAIVYQLSYSTGAIIGMSMNWLYMVLGASVALLAEIFRGTFQNQYAKARVKNLETKHWERKVYLVTLFLIVGVFFAKEMITIVNVKNAKKQESILNVSSEEYKNAISEIARSDLKIKNLNRMISENDNKSTKSFKLVRPVKEIYTKTAYPKWAEWQKYSKDFKVKTETFELRKKEHLELKSKAKLNLKSNKSDLKKAEKDREVYMKEKKYLLEKVGVVSVESGKSQATTKIVICIVLELLALGVFYLLKIQADEDAENERPVRNHSGTVEKPLEIVLELCETVWGLIGTNRDCYFYQNGSFYYIDNYDQKRYLSISDIDSILYHFLEKGILRDKGLRLQTISKVVKNSQQSKKKVLEVSKLLQSFGIVRNSNNRNYLNINL